MEGSKGGSNGQEKWFTPYKSVKKRWLDYEKHRRLKGLPIIGSLHLFTKLWKQHKEVREFKACGHAKCDMCGQIQVEKAKFEGRNDDEARQRMRELHEEQVRCSLAAVCARARAPPCGALSARAPSAVCAHTCARACGALFARARRSQAAHDKDHQTERKYAEDIWFKAETYPDRITALNMDAPTESQFDVPVQRRKVPPALIPQAPLLCMCPHRPLPPLLRRTIL